MKIEKDTAVTLRVKVLDAAGTVVDDGREPTVYLHGGYGNTFPKIEAALDGKSRGDQITLTLSADDTFGVRNEALVRTIPKKEFPPGIKVGGQLQGYNDEGSEQIFQVVKVKGDTVHLDGNHPLAGKTLRFNLWVLEVRAASAEEIAHRHVHGVHGHHH